MLDRIDHAILREMQSNARISNAELAQRVGLSASACLRRVQLLERSGVVTGYTVQLDEERLGFSASVFVQIELDKQNEDALQAFEAAVAGCPEIVECYLMAGQSDYIMRVLVRDLKDYERIHQQHLARLPGVARLHSNFSIRNVVRRGITELAS